MPGAWDNLSIFTVKYILNYNNPLLVFRIAEF